MPSRTDDLTAANMKDLLWDTMTKVQTGAIQPAEADSVAVQGREILRTVNTQLRIMNASKRPVTAELINFAEK